MSVVLWDLYNINCPCRCVYYRGLNLYPKRLCFVNKQTCNDPIVVTAAGVGVTV